jgi:predicted DNA-binding transcriptional regulator YafY
MRRRERLFAIAEYLRGRRSGVTAEVLAGRFGVTVRTVYRDLDSLRDAELPVRADRGRGGGYALDRAYTLPPVNFTPREAALLVTLGAWATGMRLLPFADTLEGALDKVRGALSLSAQRELAELMAGLQFIGVPAPAVAPAVRRAVEQAWFERQPLRIRYRSGEGIVTSRAVRIVSAIMDRSLTLLNCDDLEKGERRQFRIDRILEAKVV